MDGTIGLDLHNSNWKCPVALPNGVYLPGCSIFGECYITINSNLMIFSATSYALALAVNTQSLPVCTKNCPSTTPDTFFNGIATIGSTDFAQCKVYQKYSLDIVQPSSASFPNKTTHLICLNPLDGNIFYFINGGQLSFATGFTGYAVLDGTDNYFFVDPTSSFCTYAKEACN